MHYGWLLPQFAKDALIQRAVEMDRVEYTFTTLEPDFDPDNSDNDAPEFINKSLTMEVAVDDVITSLGIRIPGKQFINMVIAESPDNIFITLCLTVYTNYTSEPLPTDQDVQKLAAFLKLTDSPH